ncbi:hypothetical protein OF83DRAFT_506002 [Amylostereum chailletii]|nr:hypothetical protein OF83DRAFT_506002 [Amylostereum chailletii]
MGGSATLIASTPWTLFIGRDWKKQASGKGEICFRSGEGRCLNPSVADPISPPLPAAGIPSAPSPQYTRPNKPIQRPGLCPAPRQLICTRAFARGSFGRKDARVHCMCARYLSYLVYSYTASRSSQN